MTEKHKYAIIAGGTVRNIVVGNAAENIPLKDNEKAVNIDDRRVNKRWQYDEDTDEFSEPEDEPEEDSEPEPEPVDRSKISGDTVDRIKNNRERVKESLEDEDEPAAVEALQDELDDILDILDVIDLEGEEDEEDEDETDETSD